jgi:CO/xanthine dehydrogenase FAD-binding subunit
MKLWNHYHTPTTIDDALDLLARYAGQAKIIAGGTDLLVDMRADLRPPHEALIDVTRIPELGAITRDGDTITLGAGVTHTQIVQSAELRQFATCLVESCGVIGGPQVRNVATIGGNVAHALPAADGTTSLVALDAEAEIVKDGARRWLPLLDLFRGAGQSLLDSSRDLLIRFRFKAAGSGEATAFARIMRPQGVALPVLGCAVWVSVNDGVFTAARVCIAPSAPVPTRAEAVEAALIGAPANADSIAAAITAARTALKLRTSKYRATADYRYEMVGVLLRRTLTTAVERAETGAVVPEGV